MSGAPEIVHRAGIFPGQPTACTPPTADLCDEHNVPAFSGRVTDKADDVTCPACRASLYDWWWTQEYDSKDAPYLYCTGCDSFQSDGHDPDCPYVLEPGNPGAPLAHLNVGPIATRIAG